MGLKMFIFCLLLHEFVYFVCGCSWQNCPQWVEEPGWINVHMVGHTHDDGGWLKRADDYYTGVNHPQAGGTPGVQYIINTVVDELLRKPDRMFSYAEASYMVKWLEDHTQEEIDKIVQLNHNGQLEIIGGGWVQPDECSSHYVDLIDQYTIGLQLLDKSKMGYKVLFFTRENLFFHEWRMANKSIEFIWSVSDDLPENKIFTQSYGGNQLYCPPDPFRWDHAPGQTTHYVSPMIVDNPNFEEYNVDDVYEKFVNWTLSRTPMQLQQSHVLLMEGCDFWWSNANYLFDNVDRLIKYSKTQENRTKIRINYSTPGCYYEAIQNITTYPENDGIDFFPYVMQDNHTYTTGMLSSKPGLKGLIRQNSAFLQLIRSMSALALVPFNKVGKQIEKLERAMGLSQHHDAVTGTSKEFVSQDYGWRIFNGVTSTLETLNQAIQIIASKNNQSNLGMQFLCRNLNESECNFSTQNQQFAVTVYNGNSQPINTVLRVPINGNAYQVMDGQGNSISFEKISINFDEFGFLSSYTDLTSGNTFSLRQEFGWYQGVDSSHGRPSGIFVFRPASLEPNLVANFVNLSFVNSSIVMEARQIFSPWISQTIRLYPNKNFVEFEWAIGPVPKESDLNNLISKDVITRYIIPTINNNDDQGRPVFYTDSNGRQLVQRVKNYHKYYEEPGAEPVAQNYYPVNSKILISDNNNSLVILTDRSHGGSSLSAGTVELMLHRRDFYDDGFGNDDKALDEPGRDGRGLVVRGKHWLFISPNQNLSQLHRLLAFENTIADYTNNFITRFSGINSTLPPQINVLTLKLMNDSQILLRLEHIFQKVEDSASVSVDLAKIFSTFTIISAQEYNLQAVEVISSLTNTTIIINPMEIKTYVLKVQKI